MVDLVVDLVVDVAVDMMVDVAVDMVVDLVMDAQAIMLELQMQKCSYMLLKPDIRRLILQKCS